MITCNTTAGRCFIQEHTADSRDIGYGFSTLPAFKVEAEVRIFREKLKDAAEEAAFLQFLRDLERDWSLTKFFDISNNLSINETFR